MSLESKRALTDEETVAAVQSVLDELPEPFASKLESVAILVEDRAEGRPDLMGVYDPSGGLQRIVIFREANPSVAEVRKTVLHEIGHHFGMGEQHVRSLGL